ncbi:unnamed protein product, partial [Sphacelaria rigidula]
SGDARSTSDAVSDFDLDHDDLVHHGDTTTHAHDVRALLSGLSSTTAPSRPKSVDQTYVSSRQPADASLPTIHAPLRDGHSTHRALPPHPDAATVRAVERQIADLRRYLRSAANMANAPAPSTSAPVAATAPSTTANIDTDTESTRV